MPKPVPSAIPPVQPTPSPTSIALEVPKPEISPRKKFWHWSVFIIAGLAAVTVILVAVLKYEDVNVIQPLN